MNALKLLVLTAAITLAASVSAQAAIANDNHKDCSFGSAPSLTCSYTVTSATVLWCGTSTINTQTITGVTWNGVSMTQVVGPVSDGTTNFYVFRLYSPATGTHNVVSTASNITGSVDLACASYSGTSISGQPEASNTATDTSGTASTLSVSVTTVTANAWVFTYGGVHTSPGTPTGTGSIAHTYSTSGTFHFFGDTGAIASPGSVTTGMDNGTGHNTKMALITVSIAPGGAARPGCAGGLLLLGVGCDPQVSAQR